MFGPLYKTDRSRSMDKTGAGLGLYIVKNIINLHGGEISVRSGGGETEFEFTCRSHRSRTDRITRKNLILPWNSACADPIAFVS